MWVAFSVSNHLGSNRVVFTNKVSYSEGGAGTKNIVILQENQLYPYGLNTEGAWAIASPYNRYQYSDKEWNNELKWNDHGARMYDPAVGRWWVTDPANQYASPYKAMGNNPVSYVDKDGQWAWLIPIAAGALFGGLIEADKASRQGLDVGNAFWRGALIGGISGGVGGAVAKNLASQHIGGFLGGVITGASTGFASGLASGLINKNQDFFGNLIQSTLIGGGIGGALGALDVIYKNNSSNDADLRIWDGRGRIATQREQIPGETPIADGTPRMGIRRNGVSSYAPTDANGRPLPVQSGFRPITTKSMDINEGFEGNLNITGLANPQPGETFTITVDGRVVFNTTRPGTPINFNIPSSSHRITWGVTGNALPIPGGLQYRNSFIQLTGRHRSWSGFLFFR